MLELFANFDPDDPNLLAALQEHVHVVDQGERGNLDLIREVEAEVRADPSRHIGFDTTGLATVAAAGRRFRGGRFSTPCLGDLKAQLGRPSSPARLSFWILDGRSPATDIGALQAHAPPRALFQVASQFNCLESPDAFVTDIASYLSDPTQGPRACISAFPGCFVRHYAAPDGAGGTFVQSSDGAQLNLLSDVCDGARVTSGYLLSSNIDDPAAFSQALIARHDDVRIGLHDGVEVVFGHGWDGPVPDAPDLHIAQVFTSSLAAGGYSALAPDDSNLATIIEQLQRAAHFGTLLAAAALGKSVVCLTLIGGGVFGNPRSVILDAMLWALAKVEPLLHQDLTVVLNGYGLSPSVPAEQLSKMARRHGGALVQFDQRNVQVVPATS